MPSLPLAALPALEAVEVPATIEGTRLAVVTPPTSMPRVPSALVFSDLRITTVAEFDSLTGWLYTQSCDEMQEPGSDAHYCKRIDTGVQSITLFEDGSYSLVLVASSSPCLSFAR